MLGVDLPFVASGKVLIGSRVWTFLNLFAINLLYGIHVVALLVFCLFQALLISFYFCKYFFDF